MGKDCTDDMITSSANQQMKHLSAADKRGERKQKNQNKKFSIIANLKAR